MKFRDRFDKKYLKLMAYVILTVGMSYALILVMGQYQSISRMILHGLSWVGAIVKPVINRRNNCLYIASACETCGTPDSKACVRIQAWQ